MKHIEIIKLILSFVCLYPSINFAALVVAPDEYTAVDGNNGMVWPFSPIAGNIRQQQVFSSSEFSTITNPVLITEISFRPDSGNTYVGAFNQDIADIEIALSTTTASPDVLDFTFGNNIGADVVTVYSGFLNLTSAATAGPGNTYDFDITITLSTPFLYDPTAGNLLMDISNFSGGSFLPTSQLDAASVNGDSISRIWNTNVSSLTASSGDTSGLIAQFTVTPVPVPAAVWLLGSGLLGLVGVARRKATVRSKL